ncbi:MAG: acyl-CoA dehydrogenase family protein [Acidimicrobiales bacterium]
MDFSLTDEQQSVRDLAARIFGDLAQPGQLRKVEASEDRFDRDLWKALAEAGLLGLAAPEVHGGAGLGLLEACIVIEEAGRAAAPVPLTAVSVFGLLPIVRFGTDEQQERWVPAVCAGRLVVTAALSESGGDPMRPTTRATRQQGGWRLDGAKAYVPAGAVADMVLVPATADGGIGLFIVDTGASGIARRRQEASDGRYEAELDLRTVTVADDSVLVAPGPAGAEALEWLLERAMAAMCVEVAGACQAALKLTATYTSERKQFDKPVATFQAVGQRAADAYIDTEAVKLTAWHAVWRLANGLPAAEEVAVAKFWADDGAQRVVHGAQHLHGGVGVDRDYPLHRYYLLTKHLALTLGGSTSSLLRLGNLLADTPA